MRVAEESSMEQNQKSVNLAGATLSCRCHVCAFFSSREEEYEIMIPFLKEGLAAGDKTVKILDKRQRAERLERLTEGGVDAEAAERSGQLELLPWEEAHLREGRFDQDAMMGLLYLFGLNARSGSDKIHYKHCGARSGARTNRPP
jgi:hypothetical protein